MFSVVVILLVDVEDGVVCVVEVGVVVVSVFIVVVSAVASVVAIFVP